MKYRKGTRKTQLVFIKLIFIYNLCFRFISPHTRPVKSDDDEPV